MLSNWRLWMRGPHGSGKNWVSLARSDDGVRALASHPKFYYLDTGVFRSLRPAGPLDDPGTAEGAALEGLVFQHLRAWNGYGGEKHTLSYWRTRAGNEVDFVVYGKDGMHAIEVKNSKRIRPEDYSGLFSLGEEFPIAKRYLLHRGPDRFVHEGIHCIPCAKFLAELKPGKPIPQ